MYEVLQDFEVPGMPKFNVGETRRLDEAIAKVLESRGLIKSTKEVKKVDEKPPVQETRADEKPAEDKKTKK